MKKIYLVFSVLKIFILSNQHIQIICYFTVTHSRVTTVTYKKKYKYPQQNQINTSNWSSYTILINTFISCQS